MGKQGRIRQSKYGRSELLHTQSTKAGSSGFGTRSPAGYLQRKPRREYCSHIMAATDTSPETRRYCCSIAQVDTEGVPDLLGRSPKDGSRSLLPRATNSAVVKLVERSRKGKSFHGIRPPNRPSLLRRNYLTRCKEGRRNSDIS